MLVRLSVVRNFKVSITLALVLEHFDSAPHFPVIRKAGWLNHEFGGFFGVEINCHCGSVRSITCHLKFFPGNLSESGVMVGSIRCGANREQQ